MKKLTVFLFFMLLFLPSCTITVTTTNYCTNKKILDEYTRNYNYGLLTKRGYNSAEKSIDFKEIIQKKIISDGRDVELFYSTRYQQTLICNSLYFCYEYKYNDAISNYALGYVDFNTLEVHLDYFNYKRCYFDYHFSTKNFVCYTLKEDIQSNEVIDIVFFKNSNNLEFDYDITKLEYSQSDIESEHTKDYYIENGVKYQFGGHNRTLTNTIDGNVINLPYENDLLDVVPLLRQMYDKFTFDNIDIFATYISIGDELFFYIHDRPTNDLNVPFMVFKCNIDFTEVEYIGYSENLIIDIILI